MRVKVRERRGFRVKGWFRVKVRVIGLGSGLGLGPA
jgi:hypothetical protein